MLEQLIIGALKHATCEIRGSLGDDVDVPIKPHEIHTTYKRIAKRLHVCGQIFWIWQNSVKVYLEYLGTSEVLFNTANEMVRFHLLYGVVIAFILIV